MPIIQIYITFYVLMCLFFIKNSEFKEQNMQDQVHVELDPSTTLCFTLQPNLEPSANLLVQNILDEPVIFKVREDLWV